MAYKKDEGFTQIPNWYWECGLTIEEVNVIARIASWQRDKKQFYESAESLACRFNKSYSYIRKVLANLERVGIIKKQGKMKRMWRYQVCETTLNKHWVQKQCKPAQEDSASTKHNNDKNYHQEAQIVPPGSNYNTNKTSNKTSFIERESFDDSLSMDQKAYLALKDDFDI